MEQKCPVIISYKDRGKNMYKIIATILLTCSLALPLPAQDLLGERIRKITGRKRSIFLNRGIFHNGKADIKSTLNAIRHSYTGRLGYERVVFDFASQKIPKVYGHISAEEKKLYVDFFGTNIREDISSFGNSKFVDSISFYPISSESLSVELSFKSSVNVDIFYLESPGRLVVDIKK